MTWITVVRWVCGLLACLGIARATLHLIAYIRDNYVNTDATLTFVFLFLAGVGAAIGPLYWFSDWVLAFGLAFIQGEFRFPFGIILPIIGWSALVSSLIFPLYGFYAVVRAGLLRNRSSAARSLIFPDDW